MLCGGKDTGSQHTSCKITYYWYKKASWFRPGVFLGWPIQCVGRKGTRAGHCLNFPRWALSASYIVNLESHVEVMEAPSPLHYHTASSTEWVYGTKDIPEKAKGILPSVMFHPAGLSSDTCTLLAPVLMSMAPWGWLTHLNIFFATVVFNFGLSQKQLPHSWCCSSVGFIISVLRLNQHLRFVQIIAQEYLC